MCVCTSSLEINMSFSTHLKLSVLSARSYSSSLAAILLPYQIAYWIIYPATTTWYTRYSLSGACQVDVAVSTSRHADLSNAHRLAVARPKLRLHCPQPRQSRSTNSATPVSGRTQNARLKSSGMVLTGIGPIGTTEMSKARHANATSTDSVRQELLSSARPNLF